MGGIYNGLCKINEAAQNYLEDMTRFLRAIVKNPGESCDEKAHIDTIAAEMKKLDFDQVVIDPQGNVIGYMGTGDKIIAYDAHIDTVGIGNMENWEFDPYEGYETDEEIGAAAYLTSAAVSYLLFTAQES